MRGTYRMSLAPGVSRTFTVENGNVRFFGNQDLNGALDINALYTVKQSNSQGARPDVRVRVHLAGTLLAPTVSLTSPDSQRVSTADLVSYLATGQPSNQIGGPTGDYTSTAVNLFLYSGFQFSTSLCDETGFSAGVYDATQARSASGSVLSGASINCGRQIGEKTFLRLDYGLCKVGQLVGGNNGTSDPLTFTDAIGLKVEYQLNTTLTLSGGIEPPTSAVPGTSDAQRARLRAHAATVRTGPAAGLAILSMSESMLPGAPPAAPLDPRLNELLLELPEALAKVVDDLLRERGQLVAHAERRSERLQRLQEASAALSRSLDRGDVERELARHAARMIACAGVAVARSADSPDATTIVLHWRDIDGERRRGRRGARARRGRRSRAHRPRGEQTGRQECSAPRQPPTRRPRCSLVPLRVGYKLAGVNSSRVWR